jgi:hypothetical protein
MLSLTRKKQELCANGLPACQDTGGGGGVRVPLALLILLVRGVPRPRRGQRHNFFGQGVGGAGCCAAAGGRARTRTHVAAGRWCRVPGVRVPRQGETTAHRPHGQGHVAQFVAYR